MDFEPRPNEVVRLEIELDRIYERLCEIDPDAPLRICQAVQRLMQSQDKPKLALVG